MTQEQPTHTSDQLRHDLTLLLAYLSCWTEHAGEAQRFWKTFDFDTLDQLEEEGLLTSSHKAKSAYLTEDGVRKAKELLIQYSEAAKGDDTVVVRLFAGDDGQSHCEDVPLPFHSRGDQSEAAELIAGSGILVRRFEAERSNPWHHAPGRYAVITLRGAVDITVGDGSLRRLGPGSILIAEDLSGQGHETREVGPEPRISVFVPLS